MNPSPSDREPGYAAYWEEDYAKALRLLLPIAAANDPDAQCAVASLYQLGLGVEPDGVEAVRWYLLAAAGGSALACNNLSTLHRVGCSDVRPDELEARRWRDEAIRRGFPAPAADAG